MSSSYPNSNLPTMPQTPEPNNSAPENIKRQTERRKAHTAAEKRRRDAINKGYEDLQKSLPLSSNQNNSGNNENQPNNTTNSNDEGSNNSNNEPGLPPAKVSKSSILHVAVEYLDFLTKQEESNRSKIEEVDGNIKILKMVVQSFSDINKFSSELRVYRTWHVPRRSPRLDHEHRFQTLFPPLTASEPKTKNPEFQQSEIFNKISQDLYKNFSQHVDCTSIQSLIKSLFPWITLKIGNENCIYSVIEGVLNELKVGEGDGKLRDKGQDKRRIRRTQHLSQNHQSHQSQSNVSLQQPIQSSQSHTPTSSPDMPQNPRIPTMQSINGGNTGSGPLTYPYVPLSTEQQRYQQQYQYPGPVSYSSGSNQAYYESQNHSQSQSQQPNLNTSQPNYSSNGPSHKFRSFSGPNSNPSSNQNSQNNFQNQSQSQNYSTSHSTTHTIKDRETDHNILQEQMAKVCREKFLSESSNHSKPQPEQISGNKQNRNLSQSHNNRGNMGHQYQVNQPGGHWTSEMEGLTRQRSKSAGSRYQKQGQNLENGQNQGVKGCDRTTI